MIISIGGFHLPGLNPTVLTRKCDWLIVNQWKSVQLLGDRDLMVVAGMPGDRS